VRFGRSDGDWPWEAATVTLIGQVLYEAGDVAAARRRVAEALQLCAARELPTSRTRALVLSGRLAVLAGDHSRGLDQLGEGLAVLRAQGDRSGQVYAHVLAAHAQLDRGDEQVAAQHLTALLAVAAETGEQLECMRGLEGAAELLGGSDPGQAVGWISTADARRCELALPLLPMERARRQRWFPAACAELGETATAVQAAAAGRPLAQALVEARAACGRLAAAPPRRA
jgi:hypothetical protein